MKFTRNEINTFSAFRSMFSQAEVAFCSSYRVYLANLAK